MLPNARILRCCLLGLLVTLALTACAPAAPAPAEAAPAEAEEPTTPPATNTPEPLPTDTEVPTEVPTPTEEPSPTPLPPLDILEDGFAYWCNPIDRLDLRDTADTDTAPLDGARVGAYNEDKGRHRVIIPGTSCTLVYTFNQPIPEGMQVNFYQGTDENAWHSQELLSSPEDPNIAYAVLRHQMIIDPPLWMVTYRVEVEAPEGAVWEDDVEFYKVPPEPCWDNSWPNPVTLECPIQDS